LKNFLEKGHFFAFFPLQEAKKSLLSATYAGRFGKFLQTVEHA
jgi:hypothetical protein